MNKSRDKEKYKYILCTHNNGLINSVLVTGNEFCDCVRPGRRVMPGTLDGQGGHSGQSEVQRTHIRWGRVQAGQGVGKGLGGHPAAEFLLDVIVRQEAEVLHLADDQHGMVVRVRLLQLPVEDDVDHLGTETEGIQMTGKTCLLEFVFGSHNYLIGNSQSDKCFNDRVVSVGILIGGKVVIEGQYWN